jgi:hypothetical protein
MAVRLSALRAGRPLLPGRFLVLISRLSQPQGHSGASNSVTTVYEIHIKDVKLITLIETFSTMYVKTF